MSLLEEKDVHLSPAGYVARSWLRKRLNERVTIISRPPGDPDDPPRRVAVWLESLDDHIARGRTVGGAQVVILFDDVRELHAGWYS